MTNNLSKPNKTGRKKRIFLILVSVFISALGLVSLVGGAYVLYLNMATDSEGYALSQSYSVHTSSNAFALWVAPQFASGILVDLGYSNFAATKWVVTTTEPTQKIFAGWAQASDVEPYLRFRYEAPDSFWHWSTRPYAPKISIPSTATYNQGEPVRPPSEESFWTKTATTTNSTTIYWDPLWDNNNGMNVLVVMNADASSGINANIQLGFKVPILGWLPYVLIPIGLAFLMLGILLFKRRKRQ